MTLAAATAVLVILWPTGETTHEPATTFADCQVAAEAALAGLALPLGRSSAAIAAHCEPGNLFRPGWDCIKGYNCG